jgi:hypothetical protein
VISRIHQKLGTAGFIISIVALVAALGGGAYAASGGLNGKQKKEVEKIAKKYAGKPGATGSAGAAGAAGKNGTDGTNGTNGNDGANGDNGAAGESVTITESANGIEGHCTGSGQSGKGGSKFQVGGEAGYACNGKEGSPWTELGVLPAEQTETGTWVLSEVTVAALGNTVLSPVSFGLPLPEKLTWSADPATSQVHVVQASGEEFNEETGEEEASSVCLGTAENPTAAPGNLCVYVGELRNARLFNGSITNPFLEDHQGKSGAGTTGAILRILPNPTEIAAGFGTWAVAAPEE